MTKVILHGALAKRFGKEHNFLVRKPVDAIRALAANKRGFKRALKTWGRQGRLYEMICDGQKVSSEQELDSAGNYKEIHFSPTIIGTSNAAKIIVGALLIVISMINPIAGTMFGEILMGAGISLVLGGIMGLLFPPPVPSFEAEATQKSFLFSSLENAATQGATVPLGYGRMRIGTKVVSTSIEPQRLGNGNRADGNIWAFMGPGEIEFSSLNNGYWGGTWNLNVWRMGWNNTTNRAIMPDGDRYTIDSVIIPDDSRRE